VYGTLWQLSDYLTELRDMLHDPSDQYTSQAQKVRWINDALRQRDLDTGQNRILFPFTLTTGTDTYSFADLLVQNPEPPSGPTAITAGALSQSIALSPAQTVGYSVLATASWGATVTITLPVAGSFLATFSSAAPAGAVLYWQLTGGVVRPGAANVFDLIAINVIMNSLRYVMGQFSVTELNSTVRIYMPPLQWVPVRYARHGPTRIIFGPAPSSALATEWDCSTYSSPLVYMADADRMPYPYSQPVSYYAANLAKLNERQWGEAEEFRKLYQQSLNIAVNARVGIAPSFYFSSLTRV